MAKENISQSISITDMWPDWDSNWDPCIGRQTNSQLCYGGAGQTSMHFQFCLIFLSLKKSQLIHFGVSSHKVQ